MLRMPAVLKKDGYKVGHKFQYPEGTTLVYSNLTARKARPEGGTDGVVAFGMQYFVMEYLIDDFNKNFFAWPKKEIMAAYKRRIDTYLGPGMDLSHIEALHDLGYLPLHIKAVPEGTIVPFRVPLLTLYNTLPEFFWLTNMIETIMSNMLWLPITSATTALKYRRNFERYAKLTGGSKEFIQWQGHDFSMRGMGGFDAAMTSGAAHLLCFTGSDTIPAIDFLERYYYADCEKELIAGSVAATEHSVMSMGLQGKEQETFNRLLTEVYPAGLLSVVSDTWDLWAVITKYLPALKDQIMARDGKLVIRPDSGDPVKIICGDEDAHCGGTACETGCQCPAYLGVVQCLWDIFGGTVNEADCKTLDPHIGVIYGDSITPERQVAILQGLVYKGFASDNVVLGVGSYTYNYTTRDTNGLAMKATYGETEKYGPQAIFKNPTTDDGTKTSAYGLLSVQRKDGKLVLVEDCSWEVEATGELRTIFLDGELHHAQSLDQIRALIASQL